MSSSLWGCELKSNSSIINRFCQRHPPCEDVSWKITAIIFMILLPVILHVRMWVEKWCPCIRWKPLLVILHVRMWVEKTRKIRKGNRTMSSSMWGCELKNVSCCQVLPTNPSSSMWGCELKREWCKNVWYSSIALFMRKIVPSNDMNSIYVMRKRGELKEYKLQFLSIKKGLHY